MMLLPFLKISKLKKNNKLAERTDEMRQNNKIPLNAHNATFILYAFDATKTERSLSIYSQRSCSVSHQITALSSGSFYKPKNILMSYFPLQDRPHYEAGDPVRRVPRFYCHA